MQMDRTRVIFFAIVGLGLLAALVMVVANPRSPAPVAPNTANSANPAGAPATSNTPSAPAQAVEISMLTTDTKAEWVLAVTELFNKAQIKTSSGRPVYVHVTQEDSPGATQQAILDGQLKPTVWSPGDMSWVEAANQVWKDRSGRPLVSGDCPRIVYFPSGFGMWRPMAEALGWPDKPIGWSQLVDLAADPQGWGKVGHPEWGQFKFGHAHPDHSTTGFSMMATLAYATLGKTSGLTPELVRGEQVVQAFRKVELNTYHYGLSTRGLLTLMANRGPSYLHAVTTSETAVLKANDVFSQTMRFPYVFVFPAEGTFWSDNPFCIPDAEWVSAEQREAAGLYRDYLLQPAQQDMAVTIGLRPANSAVALHAPISLDKGTDPRVSPQTVLPLAPVSGDTAAAIRDVFHLTKKKATVAILLDTSNSMTGDKIKNAVEATVGFLKGLAKDDRVTIYTFSDGVAELKPSGRVGDVVEPLSQTLSGLYSGGNTALYDSICQAVESMTKARETDTAAGDRRLYGVVVLSDGDDTNSSKTESQMFGCLPSGEDVEGIKVFTIAYGDSANKDLLLRIANRTNGKTFAGDPATIAQVYLSISAEQ